ncbi:hypothetical protein JOD43_000871 [Pullulanibacillus pueri]|uniref:Uncharacterized protein n=1 Tax=Pullulanibacillus pueri TaxID=1437324 RepID=A0A8J2ZZJ9_9BACL|nr:hypothetical protein [Pullulanibacillus pueri]MBM7680707.1 hypothetical protein [Pullulanibacillus pueri]GGH87563.1 hypothetical protein GCM10007096_37870 [Pullulanibacillus pueri]
MAKNRKRREEEIKDEPIVRAADMRYGLPLDEDDWEARARMEASEHRAMKKD